MLFIHMLRGVKGGEEGGRKGSLYAWYIPGPGTIKKREIC